MKQYLNSLYFIAIVAALTFFTGCSDDDTSEPNKEAVFSSQIIDSEDSPVAGAIVKALNESDAVISSDTSEENGVFSLEYLPRDFTSFDILITHDNFQDLRENAAELKNRSKNDQNRIRLMSGCCGRVEVELVDSASGEALEGAEIRLNKGSSKIKTLKTGDDGRAYFDRVCPGEYWLRIAKDGYKVIEREFNLENCDTLKFEFGMQRSDTDKDSCCDGVVYVVAKDKETGERISGAKINIWRDGERLETKYASQEQGWVAFEGLCEGKYGIDIIHENYENIEFFVELKCNDTLEIAKELVSTDCCDGVVKIYPRDNETNEPINGATVKLWKDGKVVEEAKVKDGKVVFDNLCEGEYGVDIMHESYENIEFVFELECNETKEFEKYLQANDDCCDGVAFVYVKDKESGEFIEGARVTLWKDGDPYETGTSNGDGKVVFDNLCEGKYGVSIVSEGYKGVEFNFELGCNETKELVQKLVQDEDCCDGKVKLIVRDSAAGEPVKEAKVRLWQGSTKLKEIYTNKDGVAVFEGLCEGEYQISIIREGYKGMEFNFTLDCDEYLEFEKSVKSESDTPCCTAKLKLIIKDSETDEILSGVQVRVSDDDGDLVASGETNSEGRFAKEELCAPATYYLRLAIDGYRVKEFEIRYEICNTIYETILMESAE